MNFKFQLKIEFARAVSLAPSTYGYFYVDEISITKIVDSITTLSYNSSVTDESIYTTQDNIGTESSNINLTTANANDANSTLSLTTKPMVESEVKVFYCNFDFNTTITAQCGGSLNQQISGMTPSVQVLNNELITINGSSTSITDIKSISKIL